MRNLIVPVLVSLLKITFVSMPSNAAESLKTPPSTEKLVGERERLNAEVMRLSQPLKCKADTDCSSLPMGAKPCGGPWKYVLYSSKNSKVPALKKKLDEYNKLDQQINEKQQVMSDCSVSLEPEPKCVKNQCMDAANANAPNAKEGLDKIAPVTGKKK